MARSKYTFEKRERERVQRQKQIEKSAQRMMAKKAKAGLDAGTAGENAAVPELATDVQPLAINADNTGRE